MRIEKSSGLSESEIDRMKKDADSHAEEDQRKRKVAEARNHASRLVYETEKVMKEHADKLDAASRSAIESSIERVNKASAGDDAGAIDSAVKDLEQAAHALSKHMYESAAKSAAGAARAQARSRATVKHPKAPPTEITSSTPSLKKRSKRWRSASKS